MGFTFGSRKFAELRRLNVCYPYLARPAQCVHMSKCNTWQYFENFAWSSAKISWWRPIPFPSVWHGYLKKYRVWVHRVEWEIIRVEELWQVSLLDLCAIPVLKNWSNFYDLCLLLLMKYLQALNIFFIVFSLFGWI